MIGATGLFWMMGAKAERHALSRLRDRARAFCADKSGNVVITFTLALLPIIGFTGAAVDYSRANSAKAAMQAATDATALILSKEAQTITDAQLKAKALSYFQANFNRPEVTNLVVTPTFTQPQTGSFVLQLVSSGTIKTTFTGMWQPQLTIGANTQVNWGMKKLELALALDNTGSMAWSNKMTELKKAAKALLDTLQKAAKQPDDIKVAIIPFDTTVRLDQDHKSAASWVTFDSQQEKNTWIGCVEDRDQPNDVKDTTPSAGTFATLYPAKPCSNNGALVQMMPLTNDWDALRLRINAMDPNGATNVTIGLVWAWHALTANLPLTEALAPQPDREKVIILMTDGQNTQNRWSNSQSAIDPRTKLACDNVKAANIKLYVVRVIDGNATLLKNCATNPTMYYDVQNASQLSAVFSAIAQNLANLRLAK